MLGPLYYSIYGSKIIVEYLTQISSRVPRYLQLLNVRLILLQEDSKNTKKKKGKRKKERNKRRRNRRERKKEKERKN